MCTLAPNYSNLYFIFNKARESANNQSLLEKKGVATSTQPTPSTPLTTIHSWQLIWGVIESVLCFLPWLFINCYSD